MDARALRMHPFLHIDGKSQAQPYSDVQIQGLAPPIASSDPRLVKRR